MAHDVERSATFERFDDESSSASTNDNGKLDQLGEKLEEDESSELPSLEDQREYLSKTLNSYLERAQEGDEMCIIPQAWYDRFIDTSITEPAEIGPINTSLICRDFQNFILEDFDRHPYLSIPKPLFEKLVEWYGLTAHSQPVSTVLIHDPESDTLVTEYNKCIVRIHHLVLSNNGRYANDHPLYITTSQLSTIGEVLGAMLEAFYHREFRLSSESKVKVWYVKDSSTSNQESILTSSYRLNPLQFMQLPVKTRMTSQLNGYTLKKLGITSGDFVVEVKESGQNYHWLSNYFIYNEIQPLKGTTGLGNLGNTCYMNSALQCLVHIPELRDYFLYNGYGNEINVDNPLGFQGHIAKAFSMLVQALFMNSVVSRNNAFSPAAFKSTIGHFNGMFSGYMQQDSQEFLAFILDGLHEDLNRIHDKPYLEKPSLSPNMDASNPQIVKKLADDTWKMHLLRNDSIVTDLFVGLYKSTLECPSCETVSITFDPYSDLTLPLPVNSTCSLRIKVFPQNSPPCIIKVEISKSASYDQLKAYVGDYAKIDPKNLYGCEIFNHQLCSNYESAETMSHFLPIHELISDADDVIFYELLVSATDIIVPVLNTRIEEGFETPTVFGVPFFLVLSPQEAKNPGLIRSKLEKCYTNLSGGFVEFPFSIMDEQPSIESRPMLLRKYRRDDLCALDQLFKYSASEDIDLENYFSIKVMQSRVSRQQTSTDESLKFWIPTSRLNFLEARDITDLSEPIVRDIYNYPDFVRRLREEDNDASQNISNVNCVQESNGQKKTDLEIHSSAAPEDYEGSNQSHSHSKYSADATRDIIKIQDIIVCEWTTPGIEETFAEDKDINWEHPADLVNSELEKLTAQKSNGRMDSITLHDCLKLFSKKEILSLDDSWYCPTCKEHRQASKQIQLWNTPDILLIHLKRFESQRSFSDKIDDVVQFPIEGLDMNDYVVENDPDGSMYDLIAVDNHYGGIGGGHYTAYVKNNDKWYYFDDSRVTETDPEHSIAGSAYLLFYLRRTESGKLGGEKLQSILEDSRKENDLKIQQMKEQQEAIYATNKTDDEDLTDEESNNTDASLDASNDGDLANGYDHKQVTLENKNDIQMFRPVDYSIASLEVGLEDSETCEVPESNLGRRKLRLLNKTYTEPSASASPASSISSDGTESISAVLTGSKINDGAIPQSPAKD